MTTDPLQPSQHPRDRRSFLAHSSLAAVGVATVGSVSIANPASPHLATGAPTLKYCLNTSTIHGEVVPLLKQIEVASQAGYDAMELWLRDIDKYLNEGGNLKDLKKRITDAGLTIESAIAFAPWIVADSATHKKALEQAKKEMETIVAIGGTRIAAPPAGATDGERLDLDRAGEHYRALLQVGRSVGCLPQLEVWGFSKNLSKLSEVLYVAAAAQHPDACVLPDVYHLYKGGSNFEDLGLLAGTKIQVFHMNDYPDIPRDKISDADRVYPGDGIAPISKVLHTVLASGFNGVLSLELFNRKYWEMDPLENATIGLKKMKASVESALASK
jgi:sugar phosphate isomerase/epimerase